MSQQRLDTGEEGPAALPALDVVVTGDDQHASTLPADGLTTHRYALVRITSCWVARVIAT